MSFTSYAQNFEDVMLWRALKHIEKGLYVDVGAQHPVIDSVSKSFYERGWRGIHIEPVPQYAELLRKDRPDETVLQVAVGDTEGTLELNVIVDTGLSTAVDANAQRHQLNRGYEHQRIQVPVLTLKSALQSLAGKDVHWLKIDVEGFEEKVLKGWDSQALRPWIIVVEATIPGSPETDYASWDRILTAAGYQFVYFDGLNRFYISNEHGELAKAFSCPPNVFDNVRLSGLASSELCRGLIESHQASEKDLSTQVEKLATDVNAANENGTRLQAHAEWLQKEWDAAKQRVEELCQSMGRMEADLTTEQRNAETLAAAINGVNERNAQLQAHSQWLQNEWDAAKAKIGELNQSSHHWWTVADQLNRELQSVYASKSWRITWPLRFVNRCRRVLSQAVFSGIRRLIRSLPSTLRRVGLRVASDPWLRRRTERLFQTSLAVRERTRRFLRSTPTSNPSNEQYRKVANATNSRTKSGHVATKTHNDKTVIFYWIDHTVNCPTPTGLQRVVRWLARAMIENGEVVVFVKWDEQSKRLILATQFDLQRLSRWSGPTLPEDVLTKYPLNEADLVGVETIGAREGWLFVPEVTHITFHSEAPTLDAITCARALGLKVAFIFYDAVPLKVEGYTESREPHAAYMQHIAVADALLPISHFAAEDLSSFFVEHHGFTSETMPPIIAVPLPGENYDLPRVRNAADDPTSFRILSVGTIEPRKNQIGMIEAFNEVVRRHPTLPLRLSLVGNLHPKIAPALQQAVRDNPKIEYLQYVSDQELSRLYDNCCFTVFPSLEEGYGLPIIESLWHGKPCVCANFSAMGELAVGGGCLAVEVRSSDDLAEAMERMLVDVELRSRLRAEAASRPIKTWREYANELVNILKLTAKPTNRPTTIYYWVDQTCRFPINTGIQPVVRVMAKALQEEGARLIPVKWNPSEACFYPLSHDELCYLSRWNGPRLEGWGQWRPPSCDDAGWLVVPEEVATLAADLDQVSSCAESHGLKKAILFHGAIPYKMKDLSPPVDDNGHAKYMKSLVRFDQIFSISESSQKNLSMFLCRECERLVNLDDKLVAIPMPGEFPESERTTEYREPDTAVVRILCVGGVEPGKYEVALEAFLIALKRATQPLELIIVGDSLDTPELEKTVGADFNSHVKIRWLRSVDDAELGNLYTESHFSVYPSVEEGYGLPILESLWHARPCICRNSGAMAEVAEGGGCLTVDTTDINALADAILELVENDALRHQLGEEATRRSFKTWREYAEDILHELGRHQPTASVRRELRAVSKFQADHNRAPRLSICVTTYNRASWLAVSLENLFRWVRPWSDTVEIVVCDNASTDSTPDVVKPYRGEKNFRYYRNPVNVGMLGNLKVTAHHSKGQYVWLLGDDDLIRQGAIEQIFRAIDQHPAVGLIYLNYAYTRISEAEKVGDIDQFLSHTTPIVRPSPDKFATIKEISTLSENFFTAIYCLVFRRDHALRAYSQDTSGRPFSSLLTCIPTSFYVCQNMFNEMGYWVGEPCVVVNMNVSWGKFAPLWILERIPELYDLAEKMGADPDAVDNWRRHTLGGAIHYLEKIFTDDPEGNLAYFSMDRWIRRNKHLREFRFQLPQVMDLYARAFRLGVEGASESPETLLEKYGLSRVGNSTPRVFVDITFGLMNKLRSGLQRVEREIATGLREFDPSDQYFTFVAWNSDSRCFHCIPLDQLLRREDLPPLQSWLAAYPPVEFAEAADFFILGSNWPLGESYYNDVVALARKGMRVSVLIPDLIPIRHRRDFYSHYPDGTTFDLFSVFCREILPVCSNVLTISNYVMADIEKLFGEIGLGASEKKHVPKLHVLKLGADWSAPIVDPSSAAPDKTRPIENAYILCVGTLEKRKNHERLLEAMREVRDHIKDLDLVLVGGVDGSVEQTTLDCVRQNAWIHHFDRVDDSTLRRLYEESLFTVYPSLDEGYGLPVIESFRHGKFCLASHAGAIPEAGGEWADYFDPEDVQALAGKILKYVTNPEELRRRETLLTSYRPVPWRETSWQVARVFFGDRAKDLFMTEGKHEQVSRRMQETDSRQAPVSEHEGLDVANAASWRISSHSDLDEIIDNLRHRIVEELDQFVAAQEPRFQDPLKSGLLAEGLSDDCKVYPVDALLGISEKLFFEALSVLIFKRPLEKNRLLRTIKKMSRRRLIILWMCSLLPGRRARIGGLYRRLFRNALSKSPFLFFLVKRAYYRIT